MKGLCILISQILCLLHVSSSNGNCPTGAPPACICSGINVTCIDEDQITEISLSWLPNNTKVLKFHKCGIRQLNNESFKNLPDLESITITKQGHGVIFADSMVFQSLNNLKQVTLEENDIVLLPDALFANLPSLETVRLSKNPLQTLPHNLLENTTNVKTIRLSNTGLSSDVIIKIGKGDFGNNIEELWISGTKIEYLSDNFTSGLPKLKYFEAVRCNIRNVGADILKETKVDSLILNDNPIDFIDENALRYSKVTSFECERCKLTSKVIFNGFLQRASVLTRITLSNNGIISVPKDAFRGLTELDIIDLSNNLITSIEENPFANLEKCSSVNCVRLQDNLLNCDCNLLWLRYFAENLTGENEWECIQPINVAGRKFMSVQPNQFCKKTTPTKHANNRAAKNPMGDGILLFIDIVVFLCSVAAVFLTIKP